MRVVSRLSSARGRRSCRWADVVTRRRRRRRRRGLMAGAVHGVVVVGQVLVVVQRQQRVVGRRQTQRPCHVHHRTLTTAASRHRRDGDVIALTCQSVSHQVCTNWMQQLNCSTGAACEHALRVNYVVFVATKLIGVMRHVM